jgi:outer membrane protein TolC
MQIRRKIVWRFSMFIAIAYGDILRAEELKLEEAIQLALEHNREIANSVLDAATAGERLAALHTRLLPSMSFYGIGALQLRPMDFTITQGTLGTFDATGPVPSHDVSFRTPVKPTGILIGRVAQPLSTLYRVRLNLKLVSLSQQMAQEQIRTKRQDVVRDVKRLYYNLQQIESSLRVAGETLKLYQEVERLTAEYVAKQTVLEADHLDAQTRVARVEENQLALEDQAATQKEQLNQLLGRDILTEFTVTGIGEASDFQTDIAAARRQALDQRPETRQARLKIEQAQQDLKVKRSEYIPDVSAEFNSYQLLNFTSFLPTQFASLGVSVSWEPFDWGRKKHEMAEKRRAIEQTQNTELDARNKVLIEVNDKFRRVLESRSQLRVARLSQQTALENLRVAKRKLELESALLKDVLQAQASLEQANADYQQAVARYWTARAEFEHALGEEK